MKATSASILSCSSWLEATESHLRALMGEVASRRLLALARRLPGDCLGAFEARLSAEAESPVDLSIRLLAPYPAGHLLASVAPESLRSFLRRWEGTGLDLERIPSLWLEFDLDGSLPATLSPSLCVKLRGHFDADWLVETLFPDLQGEPLSPAQDRLVRACHEAIPPPAHLLYAFCMLPRPGRPLRLEIFGLSPAQMSEYLGRVAPQWIPHMAGPAALFEGIERTHLSLDILDGEISSRIGIEGSYERQPKREPRWRELFDRLVAAGLCAEEKREAALAWPGWDSFWTVPERWPVEAAGVTGYCIRALSHVKVVCLPDRAPEAKVYLLFGPHIPSR